MRFSEGLGRRIVEVVEQVEGRLDHEVRLDDLQMQKISSSDPGKSRVPLQQSEVLFWRYFELGELGMVISAPAKGLLEVNDSICGILGYDRVELLQKSWAELTHPDDLAGDVAEFNRVLAGEIDGYAMQKRFLGKDGAVVHAEISVKGLRRPDGSVEYFLGLVQDLTESKRVEESIKGYKERLRSFASELAITEERQRRRLATVLHNSIGQNLALAKIKLDALSPGDCTVQAISQISKLLKSVIEQTRSITVELSPPILYELGLETAVHSLCGEFQEQHGISVVFEDDGTDKRLNDDLQILLYQAIRELLVNMVKHAKAGLAHVSIERVDTFVRITVRDDGTGFDSSAVDARTGAASCFGLFSIRERLRHAGGNMKIISQPGRGTRIILTAPLNLDQQRNS